MESGGLVHPRLWIFTIYKRENGWERDSSPSLCYFSIHLTLATTPKNRTQCPHPVLLLSWYVQLFFAAGDYI